MHASLENAMGQPVHCSMHGTLVEDVPEFGSESVSSLVEAKGVGINTFEKAEVVIIFNGHSVAAVCGSAVLHAGLGAF